MSNHWILSRSVRGLATTLAMIAAMSSTLGIAGICWAQSQGRAYFTARDIGGPNPAGWVIVLDTHDNSVFAIIPVGVFPEDLALTPDGTRAYVTISSPFTPFNSITVIDINPSSPNFNKAVASIPIAIDGVPIESNPGAIRIAPDGTRAYVVISPRQPPGILVIDTDPQSTQFNTVIAELPLAVPGGGPLEITPDGSRLYIGSNDGLSVIDTASNSLTANISTPGSFPVAMVFTPDGTRAYISSVTDISASVQVINTDPASSAFNTVISSIVVPAATEGEAFSIAITPDGTRAYLTQQTGFPLPGTSSSVFVIDTDPTSVQFNSLVASFEIVNDSHLALDFTPDGRHLYITNFFSESTTVIDTDTTSATYNTVVATVPLAHDPSGVTVAKFGMCADAGGDTDGDGLCDDWEKFGLTVDVDGIPTFVDLPSMGADPNHKDIFVQADYMVSPGVCLPVVGCSLGHSHKPKLDAMALVTQAFAKAPVTNPDGTTGIRLHVDCGPDCVMNPVTGELWGSRSKANNLPHTTALGGVTSSDDYDWTEFQAIKSANFSPERVPVFHYSVWAHNFASIFNSRSGISRGVGASDFIVSLGSWTNNVGTVLEQAGTFMHELGHNLSLRHGGMDEFNRKPNYLSVMNYLFQTNGLIINGISGNLDYSRFTLSSLDENHLNENVGLNGGLALAHYGTKFFCPGAAASFAVLNANGPIDWDCDGDVIEKDISAEINVDGTLDVLKSFEDWSHLVYNGGLVGAGLAQPSIPQVTNQEEITQELDSQIPKLLDVAVLGAGTAETPHPVNFTATFTVVNRGLQDDTYSLSASANVPWAVLESIPTPITLAAGQSGTITVPLNVPASAPTGTVGLLSLKVSSETNPAVMDIAELRLTVVDGPKINISASPLTLWPPNGASVPVNISGTISSSQNPVDPLTPSFTVTDEYGRVQPSGRVLIQPDGGYSFTILLEASRRGDDEDGRQYVITVSTKDQIGIPGSASIVVTVPHDQAVH